MKKSKKEIKKTKLANKEILGNIIIVQAIIAFFYVIVKNVTTPGVHPFYGITPGVVTFFGVMYVNFPKFTKQ